MTPQRCFVQFMHPGAEHRPDRDGEKSWNLEDHRRKFLLTEGAYTQSHAGSHATGPIVFWGEWEPESAVQPVLQPREAGAPCWLHEPYYVRPASYRKDGEVLRDTEPFIFGERFLYTICRQFVRNARGEPRPTFLRDLAAGSVILFGSHQRGEFVLDTVFVVADSALHSGSDWAESLAGRISEARKETGSARSRS